MKITSFLWCVSYLNELTVSDSTVNYITNSIIRSTETFFCLLLENYGESNSIYNGLHLYIILLFLALKSTGL